MRVIRERGDLPERSARSPEAPAGRRPGIRGSRAASRQPPLSGGPRLRACRRGCCDAVAQPLEAAPEAGAGERVLAFGRLVDHLDGQGIGARRGGLTATESAGGVAQRVRQPLLDNTVGGLHLPRPAAPRARPPSRSDTSSPLPDAAPPAPARARGRASGPIALLVAEQRDEPAHVLLGLAGGVADCLEGRGRGIRVVRREPLTGGRLHNHHADRVRHDVVQLRSDPRPLVAHRQRRIGLALLLELPCPLGELRRPPSRARAARDRPPSLWRELSRTAPASRR